MKRIGSRSGEHDEAPGWQKRRKEKRFKVVKSSNIMGPRNEWYWIVRLSYNSSISLINGALGPVVSAFLPGEGSQGRAPDQALIRLGTVARLGIHTCTFELGFDTLCWN